MSKLLFCDGQRLVYKRLLDHLTLCLCARRHFDVISLLFSSSIDGLFAGPRQAAQATAQEDPSRHSAGQTPQLGVAERGRQNRQADGRGLLLRGREAGADDRPVQSGRGPKHSARVRLSGPETEPLVVETVKGGSCASE